MENYPDIRLFYLPPYSPEYNPVEQIWHWIKPAIHGSTPILKGGKEIIDRIRKFVYHWRTQRLCGPLKVGDGIWENHLTKIFD